MNAPAPLPTLRFQANLPCATTMAAAIATMFLSACGSGGDPADLVDAPTAMTAALQDTQADEQALDAFVVGKAATTGTSAPIALADRYSTGAGQQLLVYTKHGVLVNDGGQAVNGWQARLVSGPSHGAFVLNADGSFGYIPKPGFTGVDYFSYQAFDGKALSSVVSVALTVGSVSATPTTASPTPAATTSGATTGTGSGSTAGATTSTTPTPVPASTTTTTPGTSGTTTTCNSAIAVRGDQYATGAGKQLLVYTRDGVLANDGGTAAQGWSASLVSAPKNGQFAFNADGSFGYIPKAGFTGMDSFQYQARSNGQLSAAVTVHLLVGAVAAPALTGCGATATNTVVTTPSPAPVTTPSTTPTPSPSTTPSTTPSASTGTSTGLLATTPDEYSTGVGQQLLVFQTDGPLKNDGGRWDQGWKVQLLAAPPQGAFALNPDGSFGYIPPPGFSGTTSYTYQAMYAGKLSAPTVVTIRVGGAGANSGTVSSTPTTTSPSTPASTPSTTPTAPTTNPTGTSQQLVFLVAGQSNSAGFECGLCSSGFLTPLYNATRMEFLDDPYAARAPSNPHPALGTARWTNFTNLPAGIVPIQDGTSRSFWPWVYERLLTGNSKTIRSINIGVGGTFASQWTDANYLHKRFDYAAATTKIDYVLWVQGEGDAALGTSTAAYKLAMRQMKYAADVRSFAHIGAKPKWILFRSTGGIPLAQDGNPAPRQQIRQAMAELAAESPQDFLLGPDLDAVPRGLHFDTEQQFEAAVGATTAYLKGLGL